MATKANLELTMMHWRLDERLNRDILQINVLNAETNCRATCATIARRVWL